MSWSMMTLTRTFIKEKNKVAWNEKRKKLRGFLYQKNMINFEALCWVISSSKNFLFLKSGYTTIHSRVRKGLRGAQARGRRQKPRTLIWSCFINHKLLLGLVLFKLEMSGSVNMCSSSSTFLSHKMSNTTPATLLIMLNH